MSNQMSYIITMLVSVYAGLVLGFSIIAGDIGTGISSGVVLLLTFIMLIKIR